MPADRKPGPVEGQAPEGLPETPAGRRALLLLLRVGIVLGTMAAVPLALGLWLAAPALPTPTQAALGGWLVWGVPLTALAASFSPGPRARVRRLWLTLLVGWGLTALVCAAAALLVPGYPARGPHEVWCFMVFVAAVLPHLAWCVRASRDDERRWANAAVLVGTLAALAGGVAAFWLFGHDLTVRLPLTTRSMRQESAFDAMGESSHFVALPMQEEEVRAYARALGLTPLSGQALPTFPSARRPPWFAPRAARASFHDAARAASSTSDAWSWTLVVWDGDIMWATSGRAWM